MMQREEAVRRCYQIPGMCWPSELGALFDLFAGSLSHVEVGSYCGRSLFVTAMTVGEGARLTLVEPLFGCEETEYPLPYPDWQKRTLVSTLRAIRYHRPDLRLEWLQCTSVDAARIYDGLAESVYIDACHEFAECLADIEGWQAKLAPNGILAGHDYWPKDPGVMDAVHESRIGFDVISNTRIWRKISCAPRL